jgi:hypothetical protein
MQQNGSQLNRHAARLSIRQEVAYEHGYKYECWKVYGTDSQGTRIRKQFQDEASARFWKAAKEVEILNCERATRHLPTHLTVDQLAAAEGLVARLGDRYTLEAVGDYFFRHHVEADFKISVARASVAFRGAMEGVIRERSILQLRSTLSQLERFVGGESDLHEITPALLERFLRSLRARGGVNPAAKRTWNGHRADLHLFFSWCADKQRRWVAANPVADVPRMQTQNGHVEVLPVGNARALMEYVAEFKGGKLARYFASALFAGIRPGGELEKLAAHPDLIDFSNAVIRISPAISKTGKPRQIKIRENLYQWLSRFGGDLLPANHDRDINFVRKRFNLGHDVLRHTFCSAHVMAFGSFAETAIEAGNSESIIRAHYFNAMNKADALNFWQIAPGQAESKVVHLA